MRASPPRLSRVDLQEQSSKSWSKPPNYSIRFSQSRDWLLVFIRAAGDGLFRCLIKNSCIAGLTPDKHEARRWVDASLAGDAAFVRA